MKDKEISTSLVAVIVASAIVGIILSGLIIKGPSPTSAPLVPAIPASFPDVKNDSAYNNFLNTNALDLTQLVNINGTRNNSPFNSTGP